MNRFLDHYSRTKSDHYFGEDEEYGLQLGADEIENRVTDVRDAIDLLKVPPPPTKQELMVYRKQILKRIRYLESQLDSLPEGPKKKAIRS